jgi:hypothetical protein
VTIYTFASDAYDSVDTLWLQFAKAVRYHPLRHNDLIFATKLNIDDPAGGYAVAHKRDDQRKFEPPAHIARYMQQIGNRGRGNVNTDLTTLGYLYDIGGFQRTNMCVAHPDAPSAIEVIAAVQDMSERQRHLARIEARQASRDDRSPFQCALLESWDAISSIIKISDDPSGYQILVGSDTTYPRLSSYGRTPFTYADIPLRCEFFDATTQTLKRCTFSEMLTSGLWMRRALVIAGPSGLGKTWFAVALAKELAVMVRGDSSVAEAKVFISRSMQMLKACEQDMSERTPLVLDDIALGSTMFWDAVPEEYMKACATVDAVTAIRLLKTWCTLQPGPRIFTSNAKSPEAWCLLKNGQALAMEHQQAVLRRIVWIRYEARLHTIAQATEVHPPPFPCRMQPKMNGPVATKPWPGFGALWPWGGKFAHSLVGRWSNPPHNARIHENTENNSKNHGNTERNH